MYLMHIVIQTHFFYYVIFYHYFFQLTDFPFHLGTHNYEHFKNDIIIEIIIHTACRTIISECLTLECHCLVVPSACFGESVLGL